MLEIMKRNKILTYAFLMAIPMTTGNIFSSCTDDFEKLNTSNIQVDPADLPFAAQCTEPMTYCYPPQQNMFQFWTNLTIDLYGGYFMTPTVTSPTVIWERTGDIAVVCTKTIISIFSITPAASSHNVTPVVKEACQA